MSHLVQAPPATLVVAEPDRRFYAFALDRLIAAVVYAGAALTAWAVFFRHGQTLAGIGVIAVGVLVVWFVGSMLTGVGGATPGKSATGLKVVSATTGRPIGLGKALLRQAFLGVVTVPTLGIGTAALAWMAAMDGTGNRRAWHDRIADSVVVDVRPLPPATTEADVPAQRRIVNLTAMRLMPAPPEPEPVVPARRESTFTGSRPVQVPQLPEPAVLSLSEQPTQLGGAAPAPTPPAPAPIPAPAAPVRQAPASPAPVPQAPLPPAQAVSPEPPAARGTEQHGLGPPLGPAVPQTRWRVTFDTGESFVVEGLALVGRGPEPRPGEQVSHRVALGSTDMSLSKTHAQFQVVPDGTLVVMDRGSTNGTTLVRQGAARPLGARRPTTLVHGDRVRFGDREMTVVREA